MWARSCPTAGPCPAADTSCTASPSTAASGNVFQPHLPLCRSGLGGLRTPQRASVPVGALARLARRSRARHTSLRAQAAEVSEDMQAAAPSGGAKSVPKSDVWELDFCSRPILDERGKKLWELIICDPQRNFEFSRFFPNNKINSTQLKMVLQEVLGQEGAVKPEKARFFRGQMQTIITTALTDLEIQPLPSRRCFTLTGWLQERIESVYMQHPGYSEKAGTLFTLDLDVPQDLPDALRGERWCFVQLPLGDLLGEMDELLKGEFFGDRFDLSTIGAADLPRDTLIPGLCVFSRRALPLAAWTNGLELAAVKADTDRACLILETGVNQRWRYGAYRRGPETTAEASAWEEAKKETGGLHFLAIQEDEETDVAGMWLLADRPPPSI